MILLDTCTFIWQILDPTFLSLSAKHALDAHRGDLFVSNFSAFEVARLVKKKKLKIPRDAGPWFYASLEEFAIREIPLTSILMFLAEELPDIHSDPADRFIIATAVAYGMSIVTPDQTIAKYPHIKTIW